MRELFLDEISSVSGGMGIATSAKAITDDRVHADRSAEVAVHTSDHKTGSIFPLAIGAGAMAAAALSMQSWLARAAIASAGMVALRSASLMYYDVDADSQRDDPVSTTQRA